ncbi:MAG: hypothetical protein ABIF87_13575 [Pseudomonadota bacterium]
MTWRNKIVEKATDKIMAEKVVDALDKLFSRDQILFEINANERSIVPTDLILPIYHRSKITPI